MTTDQHNNILNIFYANSLKKTLKYLEENNFILEAIDSDDIEIAEIIKHLSFSKIKFTNYYNVRVKINLKFSSLILAIPETYPDNFPKIYLSKKDFLKIYPIPHLDKNRFICTRDPEIVFLNDEEPGKALKQLIEIAVLIIESGIKNENRDDFINEFLAYWNEDCDHRILGLFDPIDKIQKLKLFKLSESLFGLKEIIVYNESFLKKWLKPFNIFYTEVERSNIIYVPLNIFSPTNFNCNIDVQRIIKEENSEELERVLENYLNNGNSIIIAGVHAGEGKIVFGWKHLSWGKIHGFRKNHMSLDVRFRNSAKNIIKKINILRLDKNRILNRGGARLILNNNKISVLIIGCGSLGSFLAMSLARCGVSKFSFVDPEVLEPENIPRHLCSFVDASKKMKKVEALEKRIKEQFPYIDSQIYDDDILGLLKDNKIDLRDFDLIIVALGKESIERRINYLFRVNNMDNILIFLWMEPYGVGGHVLFINKNDGCYSCCFDNCGRFNFAISSSNIEYEKRESGCQSTFLPYSSLDIEQFISFACRIILSIQSKRPESSMLYTWLNNIDDFEKLGYKITKRYESKLPFSNIQQKIEKRCVLCCGKKRNM